MGAFQSILISISQHYTRKSCVRSKGCFGDPSSPGSSPAPCSHQPRSISVSSGSWATASRSQPRWLLWRRGGESRAERTSSGNQKPSQTAGGHLSMALWLSVLQISLESAHCWECPSPALQKKKKSFNCSISLPRDGKPTPSTESAVVIWKTCSEVYVVILVH